MSRAPTFWSTAFEDMLNPDYADVILQPLPAGASTDPAEWARSIFALTAMPFWVRAALGLRQAVVPLIGLRPSSRAVFDVTKVEGEEALIVANDRHLDFRCAVGVDVDTRLVRVVTTVKLHGWQGRVYFGPVSLAHPVVVSSMLRRARRDMAFSALPVIIKDRTKSDRRTWRRS